MRNPYGRGPVVRLWIATKAVAESTWVTQRSRSLVDQDSIVQHKNIARARLGLEVVPREKVQVLGILQILLAVEVFPSRVISDEYRI